MITPDEKTILIENAGLLIHELVSSEPMMYIQPYFHTYIIDQVSDLIEKQLNEVYFGAFICGSNTICASSTNASSTSATSASSTGVSSTSASSTSASSTSASSTNTSAAKQNQKSSFGL